VHLTRRQRGQNNGNEKTIRRGARESAPAGQRNAVMPSLFRGRNSRAAMRKTFRTQTTTSPSPTAGNTSRDSLGSVGFQTCRIAFSLKSAGREAAPAVGLEICAAADERASYSQFEFVICEFLPALNLAGETRNH
jgi:hypothetical protein